MRKFLLSSLLLGLAAVPSLAQEYKLVFADEFDGNGRPDSTIWGYEQGFVRNHEAQWYQSDNAYLHHGMLVIEARKEKSREGIPYTSASLNTKGKYSFLYGRLEVCARIPTAGGAWPAIWTLGNDMPWPSCGEIDLMEYYRINGVSHILANACWGNDQPYKAVWNSKKIDFTHFIEKDAAWTQHFHVWRMDWDETAIRLFLDDELLNEIPLCITKNGSIGQYTNPFTRPQYILLNLALGGDNGGTIDDAAFPMRYEIDYVRVYQKK